MAIEISHLNKNYGSKEALKDISITIGEGMFGLLGPNGAGKTTLMRILTTLICKSSGSVKINDVDISDKKNIRKQVGYLPQDFSVYPGMSLYEAMDYLAILSGITDGDKRKSRIMELLENVNLANFRKTKVKALSGGMKRRLGIAQTLIHDPKVLIVDEPTAGLDPEERIRVRNLLSSFSKDRTVILSTHIVEDIESTCRDLAVLKEGQLLYSGSSQQLIERAKGLVWTTSIGKGEVDKIRDKHIVTSMMLDGEIVRVRILSRQKPAESSVEAGPSVEDGYMSLVKEA